MSNKFPKYNPNRLTAERGVTLIKQTVEDEFNWIFRPTPLEHDFGIDGYIDIVNEDNYLTGKSIAVQVKTGKSYFKSKTSSGWKYSGELKHLNYYINLNQPVLICIVDIELKNIYWEKFDLDKISKTKKGWSITINGENKLQRKHKDFFHSLPGFEIDYLKQLEYQWEVNKQMKESGLILLSVERKDVEELNLLGFKTLLKRLTIDDEMIEKCQGKLTFVIDGYNFDKRELFEIPEVRNWVKKVLPEFKYWGYFLNLENKISQYSGLTVLHLCSVEIKLLDNKLNNTNNQIEFDLEQTSDLMLQLFGWLNEFADKYQISKKINESQSSRIYKILMGKHFD